MKKTSRLFGIAILCVLLGFGATGCDAGDGNGPEDAFLETAVTSPGENLHPGLYPAAVNAIGGYRWGYIDKEGNFVIQPQFATAEDFQDNGLAVVLTGDLSGENHSGVIDREGRFKVEAVYDYIQPFSDGIAIAMGKEGTKAVNEKGKVIFESKDYIANFSDGLAVFSRTADTGAWLSGYINTKGEVAIEPRFDMAGDFKDGKAIVRAEGTGISMIDKTGKTLHLYPYDYIGELGDGLLAFKENDKYGYIDETGKVVIPPRFYEADSFKEGLAVVNLSGDYSKNSYGLIDKKGKFIIQPEYNDIQALGEGFFAVGIPIDKEYLPKGSIYAIANKTGKLLTDFIYYGVSQYHRGYASAYDKNTTFFIDGTGKKVPTLPVVEGNGTLKMEGDLIKKEVGNRTAYFDKSGKVIYKPDTEVQLSGALRVREAKFNPNRNYLVYYPQIAGMKEELRQLEINEKLERMAIDKSVTGDEELDYNYQGDYIVAFFKKNLLGLRFTGYNYPFGAAHGMPAKTYAYVDVTDGKFYQLKDLFKQDSHYLEKLSGIVRKQIESQGEETAIWLDSYEGIKEDQPFVITEDALTLYFTPYEIAPYAAGFPEFTIPYKDIMDIINTKGSFWKAFNE